jgi:hypothetical protein
MRSENSAPGANSPVIWSAPGTVIWSAPGTVIWSAPGARLP